jgi:hypothetical protein
MKYCSICVGKNHIIIAPFYILFHILNVIFCSDLLLDIFELSAKLDFITIIVLKNSMSWRIKQFVFEYAGSAENKKVLEMALKRKRS